MSSYIYNLGLHFDRIASVYQSKTAIQFSDGLKLSYGELNDLSDSVAIFLLSKGIQKGDVCAIAGVKRSLSYAALIGCLKIGAIYSFFDPESPLERLSKILNQSFPKIILAYLDEVAGDINSLPYHVINLNSFENQDKSNSITKINLTDVEGSSPAYIMFTSGSTGLPKGAVMSHANVLNFINWTRETYNITTEDIHTNVNPLYFDNSVFDIYASLFNGATLVPINKKEALHPKILLEIIELNRCTTWFSVPSMLIYIQTSRAILPEKWRFVKKIIFGGEGYPKARLVKLFNTLHPNTSFYNVYGPTECTCICSSYAIGKDDFEDLNGFLPLGKMASNFSWKILDESGMETRGKGDLALGGPNVGLGYYNDHVRTSERFFQNPGHNNYKDIFYRTGDLVSFNEIDGKIYIHGRTDNQVKHMGYRIELEEIESAINQFGYVQDAAAFVVGESNNNKIFVVFATDAQVDLLMMKTELMRYLPSYMMPHEIIAIDRIPKNSNGKTDRLALTKKFSQWQKS